MKKTILALLFISSISYGARVEDVQILEIKNGPTNTELKLHSRTGEPGSYFYVDIVKEDTESFEKLSHIVNKLAYRNNYRLDLDIISFSARPSGGYYRSDSVTFIGKSDREPNSVKTPKKKRN